MLPRNGRFPVACLFVAQQWPLYYRLFSGRCLSPGKYVTICCIPFKDEDISPQKKNYYRTFHGGNAAPDRG
jgi:hypothetical protein